MMERWLQITCNGCGATETNAAPNQTATDFRAEMRRYGWKRRGNRDYCRLCVDGGIMRERFDLFNGSPVCDFPR